MCVSRCVGSSGEERDNYGINRGRERYVFGRLWGVVLDSKEKGRSLGHFEQRFSSRMCDLCLAVGK